MFSINSPPATPRRLKRSREAEEGDTRTLQRPKAEERASAEERDAFTRRTEEGGGGRDNAKEGGEAAEVGGGGVLQVSGAAHGFGLVCSGRECCRASKGVPRS